MRLCWCSEMRKLNKLEYSRWTGYTNLRNSNYSSCKVGRMNWSLANGWKHELAKFKLLYDLSKEGHKCITEAIPKCDRSLKHDLVNLSTGEIFEVVDSCLSKKLLKAIDEGYQKVEIIKVKKDGKN